MSIDLIMAQHHKPRNLENQRARTQAHSMIKAADDAATKQEDLLHQH